MFNEEFKTTTTAAEFISVWNKVTKLDAHQALLCQMLILAAKVMQCLPTAVPLKIQLWFTANIPYQMPTVHCLHQNDQVVAQLKISMPILLMTAYYQREYVSWHKYIAIYQNAWLL